MNEEQLKKMHEELTKSVKDGLDALKTAAGEQAELRKKENAVLEAKLAEVSEKLAKLEAAPVKTVTAPAIIKSTKFLGRNISRQMVGAREKAYRDRAKDGYEHIHQEEHADNLAKFFLASALALKFKNPEALKYLEEVRAKAAMQEDTTTEGGFLVPTEYEWDMLKLSRDLTWALRECRVIDMGTNDMRVPKEGSLASVAWTAEEVAATESEPTVGQVQLTAKRLDAFAIVSNELLQDAYVDVAGMLAEQFSYGINLELDNQVLNGDGTKLGSGVLTAAAGFSVVQTGAGSQFFSSVNADFLSDMIRKVDEGYIPGGKFVYNKLIMHYIRTLKDTQGRYVYAAPGNGVPGTIWEYPYIQSSKGPSTTATATPYVVFGNFKYYVIGRRVGSMVLEIDPYGLFTTNQTRYRVVSRWAGKIGQANAFCRLLTA